MLDSCMESAPLSVHAYEQNVMASIKRWFFTSTNSPCAHKNLVPRRGTETFALT